MSLVAPSSLVLIMLYKVVLSFQSVDEVLKCDHSNRSYWAVLSCGAVYYAVQGGSSFQSVDEILKCDHSNGSYWAVLSCGADYYAVQGGSNVSVCGWNPKVWPLKWEPIEQYFPVVLFIMLYKVALTFQSVDEILKCGYLNESYWAVLPWGTRIVTLFEMVLTLESVDKILKCDHSNESIDQNWIFLKF